MLARDRRLRIVQREIGGGNLVGGLARECRHNREATEGVDVACLRGVEQRLGLLLQMFEIRADRKIAGRHTTSMLSPVVRKQAARRLSRVWNDDDGGLGPSREPAGAL